MFIYLENFNPRIFFCFLFFWIDFSFTYLFQVHLFIVYDYVLILFFLSIPMIQKNRIKDVKLQRQIFFNNASSSSKNITQHCKKNLLKMKRLKPFVQGLQSVDFFTDWQKHFKYCLASNLTNDHCGKHDTSHYQTQPPAGYN